MVPLALLAQESDPAEQQPMAVESLLLDIITNPAGGYIAAGERGHIVLSEDGDSWRQAANVPTRSTLTSLAATPDRLWVAGHDTIILSSEDGGETWTQRYLDVERQQPILDLVFTGPDTGYAMGAYGLMLVTADGGETWDEVLVSEDEWHLNSAVDLGNQQLVVTGEAGFSYRSVDAGQTWDTIEMPYPGSMFGITQAGDCLMVFGLRGHAQESCDGGMSWVELDTGTVNSLSGASLSGGGGIRVGNSGTVLEREDDGGWAFNLHSSGVDFAAALARGDGRWLLVGEEGVHHWPETTE